MAKYETTRGQTGNIAFVFLPDTTSITGGGKTGITHSSAGLNVAVRREKIAAMTSYTGTNVGAIATLGSWVNPGAAKCNIGEVDSTNAPGLYELHFEDSQFSASDTSRKLVGMIQVTGAAPAPFEVELTGVDLQAAAIAANVLAWANASAEKDLNGLPSVNVADWDGAMAPSLDANGNLPANVVDWKGAAAWTYLAPTNLTAAQIATAIWQDATAGDFTVANSVGKVVYGQLGGALTSGTSIFTVSALQNAPSGGGGGGFGGPSALTLNFTDSIGNPVGDVIFTIAGVGAAGTGGSGSITVALNNGSYVINAAPAGGILFPSTAVTVAGETTLTIAGTGAVIPPPPTANQVTAVMWTRDVHGTLLANVPISIQMQNAGAVTDQWSQAPLIVSSDGTGLWQSVLEIGATYTFATAQGLPVTVTVPAGATSPWSITPEIMGA